MSSLSSSQSPPTHQGTAGATTAAPFMTMPAKQSTAAASAAAASAEGPKWTVDSVVGSLPLFLGWPTRTPPPMTTTTTGVSDARMLLPPVATATSGGWTAAAQFLFGPAPAASSSTLAGRRDETTMMGGEGIAATSANAGTTSPSSKHPLLVLSAWYELPIVAAVGPARVRATTTTTTTTVDNATEYGEDETAAAPAAAAAAAASAAVAPPQQRQAPPSSTPPQRRLLGLSRILAWPAVGTPPATPHVATANNDDDDDDLLLVQVAIETTPHGAGIVRAYAANAVTGDVVMWSLPLVEDEVMLEKEDEKRSSNLPLRTKVCPPDALVRLPLLRGGDNVDEDYNNTNERITSLDLMTTTTTTTTTSSGAGGAGGAHVDVVAAAAVGTSHGNLYWVRRTTNPLTLQAWRVVPTSSLSSSASSLAGMFQVASWFSPAPKKPRLSPPSHHQQHHRPVRIPPQSNQPSSALAGGSGAVVQTLLVAPPPASSEAAAPAGEILIVVVRAQAVEVWSIQAGGGAAASSTSNPSFRRVLRHDLAKQWVGRLGLAPSTASTARIVAAAIRTLPSGASRVASSAPIQDVELHVLVKELDNDDEYLHWVEVPVSLAGNAASIRSVARIGALPSSSAGGGGSASWVCRGMQVAEDGTRYVAFNKSDGQSSSWVRSASDVSSDFTANQLRSLVLAIEAHDEPSSTLAIGAVPLLDMTSAGFGAVMSPIRLDSETQGCVVLTTTGHQVLVRFARAGGIEPVGVQALARSPAETDPAAVARMVSQLRGTVRELLDDAFHFPSGVTLATLSRHAPPRLDSDGDDEYHTRLLAHVETAILQLSREELRRRNSYDPDEDVQGTITPASAYRKLERHESLVLLMRRGGLYRTLSVSTKVELFAMGQQLQVFTALITAGADGSPRSERLLPFVARLSSPADLEEWFESMEHAIVEGGGDRIIQGLEFSFAELVCEAITASDAYRADRLQSLYGVSKVGVRQTLETIPLWTHIPHFQAILRNQLQRWMKDPPQGLEDQKWHALVETIVVATLQSFRDTYGSMQRDKAAEQHYAEIQDVAIPLISRVLSSDEKAWNLSVEHGYFEGLCAIARRHEHRQDRELYTLDPLFKHFNGKSSAGRPGVPFCHFVLGWHAEESLLGHVLEHGEHCPGALSALLEGTHRDDQLHTLQWIHSIRNGDNEKAAESLLSNATKPDLPLESAKVELAMASLANRVAAGSSLASHRRAKIDALRNLVAIQEELISDDMQDENKRFQTPEELLQVVFQKVPSQQRPAAAPVSATARVLLLGLLVCTALPSTTDIVQGATQVWLTAIQQDREWLERTLENEASSMLSLSHETIGMLQDRTVFGTLLRQFAEREKNDARLWRQVSYLAVEKHVRAALPSATLVQGLASLALATSTN